MTQNGHALLVDGKRITPEATIKPPSNEMKFRVNEDYFDTEPVRPEDIKIIKSAVTIQKYGCCLVEERISEPPFYKPKKYHTIASYPNKKAIDITPEAQGRRVPHFEYDGRKKRIRYVGPTAYPNGCTAWHYLNPEIRKKKEERLHIRHINFKDYQENPVQYLIDLNKIHKGMPIRRKFNIPIKNKLILGEDKQENIITIPITLDEIRLVIGGIPGRGKSVLAHTIADQANLLGRKLIILHDNLNKFHTWTRPSPERINAPPVGEQTRQTIKPSQQWARLNLTLRGLAAVYFHPYYKRPGEEKLPGLPEGHYYFSIPYKEYVEQLIRYARITTGTVDHYQKIKPRLLQCYTRQDYNILWEQLYAENKDKANPKKIPQNSLNQIQTVLTNTLNAGLLDLDSPVPSLWTIKTSQGQTLHANPLIITSYAGAIPILVTHYVKEQLEFPGIILYIMDDLNRKQKSHPLFSKTKYWVMIDEYPSVIWSPDNRSKEGRSLNNAAIPSVELTREGRNNRIGVIYVVQTPNDLPPSMGEFVTYYITFNAKFESKEFAKKQGLNKQWINHISQLERFEFIATTNDQLVLIQADGSEKRTSEPVLGTTHFPLSMHNPPTSEEKKR